MKTCTWCKVEKHENEYNKKKGGLNGLSAHCRQCQKERHVLRYKDSKPHLKYYSEHRDEMQLKRDENRVELRKYQKLYREQHREELKRNNLRYIEKDPVAFYKRNAIKKKVRRASDPYFALVCNVRSLITSAFKRMSINGKMKTNKEYGIDYIAIFNKIGPRPGSGKDFHLDHIIPLSAFDLDNALHVKLAHQPCNLRWISKKENLEKSASIPDLAFEDLELKIILQTIGRCLLTYEPCDSGP